MSLTRHNLILLTHMFNTYLPRCYNINITVIVLIRKKRQANKLMCTCVEQLAEVYYILS